MGTIIEISVAIICLLTGWIMISQVTPVDSAPSLPPALYGSYNCETPIGIKVSIDIDALILETSFHRVFRYETTHRWGLESNCSKIFIGVYGEAKEFVTSDDSRIVKRGSFTHAEASDDFGAEKGQGIVIESIKGHDGYWTAKMRLDKGLGIQRISAGRFVVSLRFPKWGVGALVLQNEFGALNEFGQKNWARVKFELPEGYRLESSSPSPAGISLPNSLRKDDDFDWINRRTTTLIYEVMRGTTDIQFILINDQAEKRALYLSMLGPAFFGAGIGFIISAMISVAKRNQKNQPPANNKFNIPLKDIKPTCNNSEKSNQTECEKVGCAGRESLGGKVD